MPLFHLSHFRAYCPSIRPEYGKFSAVGGQTGGVKETARQFPDGPRCVVCKPRLWQSRNFDMRHLACQRMQEGHDGFQLFRFEILAEHLLTHQVHSFIQLRN